MYLLSLKPAAWRWVSKTLLTASSIVLAFFYPSSLVFWAILLIFAVRSYLSQLEERKLYKSSFWLLFILTVLTGSLIQKETIIFKLFLAIFFSAMFFIKTGLGNLFFSRPKVIYDFFNSVLVITGVFVGLKLIHNLPPGFFWSILPLYFLVFFLIFKEVIALETSNRHHLNIVSASLSFIIGNILIILLLLPLNIFGQTGFIGLLFIILKNLIKRHKNGTLTAKFCLTQASIFVVLTLLIFGTATWSI